MDHNLYHFGTKLSIYLILFSLFVLTLGFIFIGAKNYRDQAKAANNIDSLYEEIGKLNDQNTKLYNQFVETQSHLKTLYASIFDISNDLSRFSSSGEDLNNLIKDAQDKLNRQSENIESILSSSIYDLNEVSSDEFMDVLIIGSHGSLTDTIMIARILESKNKILFISLPRDIYYNGRKINEIYNSYGIDKLNEAIVNITGVVIEKYVELDINGFTKIFDILFKNGLKVNVEKKIYDNAYPDGNFGYTVFSLNAGEQLLNAVSSLKYVRTRHQDNDFERAKRQQNFLNAAFSDLKNQNFFETLENSLDAFREINKYVQTDISIFEALNLFDKYKGFELETGYVIDNREKNFTLSSGENFASQIFFTSLSNSGQYILIPVGGDFSKTWEYVASLSK